MQAVFDNKVYLG